MIVAALWIWLVSSATPQIPCLIVKPYVAIYGIEATIWWARLHGYTQAQITDIRKRCVI